MAWRFLMNVEECYILSGCAAAMFSSPLLNFDASPYRISVFTFELLCN